MKKSSKRVWIIALVLVLVGAVLMCLGWMMDARGNVYIDKNGIHANQREETKIVEHNIGAFTNLVVDVPFADVELLAAAEYGLEMNMDETVEPTWSIQDGTLTVKAVDVKQVRLNLFESFEIDKNIIKIYLPTNAALKTVHIRTDSGDIALSNTKIDTLTVNNSFGDLKINAVTAGTVTIDMSSGDVTIVDSEADAIDIQNAYGDVTANRLIARGMKINASSGEMNLQGTLSGKNDIHAEYGDVHFRTTVAASAYSYALSTSFGDITLNGKTVGEVNSSVTKSGIAPNSLTVQSSAGDVAVDFG
jgi:DUF4097 and DUF4098 domain-containing protein YvlB